jgi:hypothetical protein
MVPVVLLVVEKKEHVGEAECIKFKVCLSPTDPDSDDGYMPEAC